MSQVCGVFVRAWRTFGYNRSRAPGAAARGALRSVIRSVLALLLTTVFEDVRTLVGWDDMCL